MANAWSKKKNSISIVTRKPFNFSKRHTSISVSFINLFFNVYCLLKWNLVRQISISFSKRAFDIFVLHHFFYIPLVLIFFSIKMITACLHKVLKLLLMRCLFNRQIQHTELLPLLICLNSISCM